MVRPGRKYHRGRYWIQQRDKAFERSEKDYFDRCEVTQVPLTWLEQLPDRVQVRYRRACHHILGERWARKFIPGCDPHILENLMVISVPLHSQITAIEAKLTRFDWLGWRIANERLGVPLDRLDAAFRALCASVKKPLIK